jgi:hypothetical protein
MRFCRLITAFVWLASTAALAQGPRQFPSAEGRPPGGITDADLAAITNPEELEEISLRGSRGYGNDEVTDAGIAHLAHCENLRVLKAGALGLTDASLAVIGGLTKLEVLELDSNEITGPGLHHLAGLKSLRRLSLHFNPLTADAYQHLLPLDQLTHFSASEPPVTDELLVIVARLPPLEELSLSEQTQAVTDAGLRELAKLTRLRRIRLKEAPEVTDAGLHALGSLTSLESLTLGDLRSTTPRGLDVLRRFPDLRELHLSGIAVDQQNIAGMANLAALQNILIWSIAGDAVSLEPLAGLRRLRAIRTNNPLDSTALRALAELPDLEYIGDELTEVTDEDLFVLAKMPKLRSLMLDSEHITAAALPALAQMKSLRSLNVSARVRLSPQELITLGRESLPECTIAGYRPGLVEYQKPDTTP